MKKEFKYFEKLASSKFVRELFKWLYPGIGLKRWIGMAIFGVILIIISSAYLRIEEIRVLRVLDTVILISGIIILVLSIKRIVRSFVAALVPASKGKELIDILYQSKHLDRGPKIVTLGGGTGLSMLLMGLKAFTSNITAIVTVADDGGSSGRLRQQFDILPPGDIRNCLVALADAPALMRDLFQFRFDSSSPELSGHSFGNLYLTAMTRLTGDFEKAIKETSKVLALKGQVIPSTLNNVVLVAEHKNGSITEGENKIPKAHIPINRVSLKPAAPVATPEAIKAIEEAQIIILGPGSLYTSIIPNLLIKEIANSIVASNAIKVYVCNLMTQQGETDEFKASDHIKALIKHSHQQIIDYCILNTSEVPASVLKRYSQEKAYRVVNDAKNIRNLGYRVIEDDFVLGGGVVRHDSLKLARMIFGLIEEV